MVWSIFNGSGRFNTMTKRDSKMDTTVDCGLVHARRQFPEKLQFAQFFSIIISLTLWIWRANTIRTTGHQHTTTGLNDNWQILPWQLTINSDSIVRDLIVALNSFWIASTRESNWSILTMKIRKNWTFKFKFKYKYYKKKNKKNTS